MVSTQLKGQARSSSSISPQPATLLLRASPASDRMAPLARTALLVGVAGAGASYLAPAFLKSRSYMSPIGINRDCTHTMEILLFMLNT